MAAAAPAAGTWAAPDRGVTTRRWINRLMLGLAVCAILVAVVPLLFVLGWVALQGLPALNLDFFTQVPGPPDDPHTGFANGIAGTAILLAVASLISVPIGIGAGIYLSEFGGSRLPIVIRFATDVLSGV